MEDPKRLFRKYCRENELRYTPERAVIIDEIYLKDGHFDIDNLFLRIRNRHPGIRLAKGSIYRTIPHLIKAGLIRESFKEEGRIFYEHTLGHGNHDHMICIKCGKIFEFYDKKIDSGRENICEEHGFDMVFHVHVIQGYCSKCRNKKGWRQSA